MDDIKSKIVSAFKTSKKLRITGYVDSKGEVKDLEVEMIGPSGYLEIVKKSHEFILNLKRPEIFSAYDWTAACAQQLESWEKALSGVGQRMINDDVIEREGGAYFENIAADGDVALRNLKNLGTPEIKKVAAHRDEVTAAKAWIRQNSPVAAYINMLILRPGKFQSVEVL